ncbi:MAG: OsmC family protein [Firmicutes bacterium]|nr:OsmC family protein [Bacillota bacterium]
MKLKVNWNEGMTFTAHTPSGHTLFMDTSETSGGKNSGARPLELLLAGVGGCTGMDVVSILGKMKQQAQSVEIEVVTTQAEEHPRQVTHVMLHYTVTGTDLDEAKVNRAVQLSVEKYCIVANSLKAEIAYDVTINNV